MRIIVAIFWSAWTMYLAAQAIRNKREPRIGYFLSACLTAYTAWLPFNPGD